MLERKNEPLDVEELPVWQRERRARILDAALRALAGRSYQQVQIRDVAVEAGVALGTVYRYFTSKEHVYAAALRSWGLELESLTVTSADDDAATRLRAKAHRVVAEFASRPELLDLFRNLAVSSDDGVLGILEETANSGRRWFADELSWLGREESAELSMILWSVVATAAQEPRTGPQLVDRFFHLLAGSLQGALHQDGHQE